MEMYLNCGDDGTGVYIFQNSFNSTLKIGAFFVCQLYLNKVDLKTQSNNNKLIVIIVKIVILRPL